MAFFKTKGNLIDPLPSNSKSCVLIISNISFNCFDLNLIKSGTSYLKVFPLGILGVLQYILFFVNSDLITTSAICASDLESKSCPYLLDISTLSFILSSIWRYKSIVVLRSLIQYDLVSSISFFDNIELGSIGRSCNLSECILPPYNFKLTLTPGEGS